MNKGAIFVIVIVLVVAMAFGLFKGRATGQTTMENEKTKVLIETSEGDITIELYEKEAPITTKNFLEYVNDGFYDGTIFHRVIEGFMVQGGGYTPDGSEKETNAPIKLESNNGLTNDIGTVAMARTAVPDSATSQFFINAAQNDFLNYGVRDEGYAVFGKVVEGMDVVKRIEAATTDVNDKPLKAVEIIKIKVV